MSRAVRSLSYYHIRTADRLGRQWSPLARGVESEIYSTCTDLVSYLHVLIVVFSCVHQQPPGQNNSSSFRDVPFAGNGLTIVIHDQSWL